MLAFHASAGQQSLAFVNIAIAEPDISRSFFAVGISTSGSIADAYKFGKSLTRLRPYLRSFADFDDLQANWTGYFDIFGTGFVRKDLDHVLAACLSKAVQSSYT